MGDQQFKLPLSGDVSQQFSFWNMFNAGGQIGLINVDLGKSGDPDLEHEILDTVGTYGRQLGQIGDALDAVLRRLDTGQWDEDGDLAVKLFRNQLEQIALLREKRALHEAQRTRSSPPSSRT